MLFLIGVSGCIVGKWVVRRVLRPPVLIVCWKAAEDAEDDDDEAMALISSILIVSYLNLCVVQVSIGLVGVE